MITEKQRPNPEASTVGVPPISIHRETERGGEFTSLLFIPTVPLPNNAESDFRDFIFGVGSGIVYVSGSTGAFVRIVTGALGPFAARTIAYYGATILPGTSSENEGIPTADTVVSAKGLLHVDLERAIHDLFENTSDEPEEGTESPFDIGIRRYIANYGKRALDIIMSILRSGRLENAVIASTLLVLGLVRRSDIHEELRTSLETLVRDDRYVVARGAVMALSELDDSMSLTVMEQAATKIEHPLIRKLLSHLIDQLRTTANGQLPERDRE